MCHPNTSEATLLMIAKRKDRSLHLALLKRPLLSPEVLFILMGGHDRIVRMQAAAHPGAASLLPLFARAGASAELQGFSAFDESLEHETLSRFATGGLYAQHLAARHPNTKPNFLRSCLTSLRASLRRLAAQNPSSPQEVLLLLQRLGANEALTELEAPDDDVSEEEFIAAKELGAFGELLATLMQPLQA
jgi:hypothetical protein